MPKFTLPLAVTIFFSFATQIVLSVEFKKETARAAAPSILYGSVAHSALFDNLRVLGIKCEIPQGAQYPIVAGVEISSPAYYSGIVAKDQIMNCKITDTGFAITIKRGGKLFQAQLRSMTAGVGPGLHGGVAGNFHPFLPAQIAKDGLRGVEQSNHPDCWFEASLAALANTPRGQQLISGMITRNASGFYWVTFRGNPMTPVLVDQSSLGGLRDRATWASIIEAASLKSYDARKIARSLHSSNRPAIQIGMKLLTGASVTAIRPDHSTPEVIRQILIGAMQNRVPVALASKNPREIGGPTDLKPNHAYAFVSIDPFSNNVTLKDACGGRLTRSLTLLVREIRYVAYPNW